MFCQFQKRTVKPTAWKCSLEIGKELQIPISMYVKTKENKLKQTWRKREATSADAEVVPERIFLRLAPPTEEVTKNNVGGNEETAPKKALQLSAEDQMQVDKEELVKGSSLLPAIS